MHGAKHGDVAPRLMVRERSKREREGGREGGRDCLGATGMEGWRDGGMEGGSAYIVLLGAETLLGCDLG
jgi:hypothetical protein